MPAARSASVRRSNLAFVLDLLRRRGPSSRSQLVAATGLTRSAIAGLVGELEALGLVAEAPSTSAGRPGRPSPVVQIAPDSVAALSIEIFVDEIGAAVVGLDGAVVGEARLARPRERVSPAATITDVKGLVERVEELAASARRRVISCGVAVPGLIRDNGVVVAAPNLGWSEVALTSELKAVFGRRVPVRVGNDADLGALAESRFGAGAGSDHMIFISGEVGVGGGVVIEGRPVIGHRGFGGEVGHVPVNPQGRPCSCGSIGCWETEVGEAAMLERAGLAGDAGREGVEQLLSRAGRGDAAALDALDAEAWWLAVGIAGLINTFDLDTVVLGGLFARILPSIRSRLDDELQRRRYRAADRTVAVVGAALGSRAVTVGAAELAFAELLDDPAGVMNAAA